MILVFLIALISWSVSLVLTGIVRTVSLRIGLLDRPNSRSSHNLPTPRSGGVAFIAASELGVVLAVFAKLVEPREAIVFGIGMLVLAAVGLVDDVHGVGAGLRLCVHIAVASWTVYMFHGLPLIQIGSESLAVGKLGYFLGILGISWSINLFNFMDGIDGLAGSQAVLILGTIALLLFWRGDTPLGTIALIFGVSAAGFLPWNWPPAKIFMGDVGSGVIGYAVAALAIASENNGSIPLLAFVIASGLFIADATVTLLRRQARGERPAEAHREHAYQRLARDWGSHRRVTATAAAVTTLLGVLAAVGSVEHGLLLPALCAACIIVGASLITIERRAPMRSVVASREPPRGPS